MPQYADALSSLVQGQQFVDGLFQQRARREAGGQLSRGNVSGAANTLLNQGELQAGLALQDRQAEQVAASRAASDATRAQQLQATLQITGALRRVRDSGGDVISELPKYRDAFIAMGTDPAQLQQIETQVAANPAFLDQIENITGQQLRELQIVNLGDGNAVAIDQGTGDVVNRYSAPRRPQRVAVGNDYIEVGEDGSVTPLYQGAREPEYRSIRNSDGTESIVELGGRPGGVIGSGSGFGSRDEVLSFITPIVGDFRPTSGARSREEQDGLIARGATSAYNSAHVNGLGQDIVPSAPQSEWEGIAERLRSTGQFSRVLVETGRGRNQGTGAHIHLEPRVGSGNVTPASGNQPRVVAQSQNNGLTPAEQRSAETADRADRGAQSQLRREFNGRQEVRDFREVESAYNNVRSAAQNPSAAGDLSMIFAYMKMLDPGSVVREQEFANAQNAAGVPDRIRNQYNRVLNGQRLNPNQRQDFVTQAERLYGARRDTFSRIENEYRTEAELSGYDPNRIVPRRPEVQTGRRLRFAPTEAQAQASQTIVRNRRGGAEPARGSIGNPIIINAADARGSYGNVRAGQYFMTPDGQVRQRR